MNKLIALLGRNSLLVNYFSFFALSLLLNVLYVYLPFWIYITGEQVVKFFLSFCVAIYVTNHRKIMTLSFWGILAVSVLNFAFGLLLHYVPAFSGTLMNQIAGSVVSLISLSVLLLLWQYALPRMRGIIVMLFLLEIYNFVGVEFWSQLLASLLGNREWAATLGMIYIPFLLLIFLLVFIFKEGKKRWPDRIKR